MPSLFNESSVRPVPKKRANEIVYTGYNVGQYKNTKMDISDRNQRLLSKIDRDIDDYRVNLNKFKSKYTTMKDSRTSSSTTSSSNGPNEIDVRNLAPITESNLEPVVEQQKRLATIPPIIERNLSQSQV